MLMLIFSVDPGQWKSFGFTSFSTFFMGSFRSSRARLHDLPRVMRVPPDSVNSFSFFIPSSPIPLKYSGGYFGGIDFGLDRPATI